MDSTHKVLATSKFLVKTAQELSISVSTLKQTCNKLRNNKQPVSEQISHKKIKRTKQGKVKSVLMEQFQQNDLFTEECKTESVNFRLL